MLKYILKRVLIFIPTLIVITLLGFVISINAPGDPVERMVSSAHTGGELGTQSLSQMEDKLFWRKKLGLDLPVFYFSITSVSRPDTLYKIYDKSERDALDRLISKYGNWTEIQKYYHLQNHFYNSLLRFNPDTNLVKKFEKNSLTENINELKYEALALKSAYDDVVINAKLLKINALLIKYSFLKDYVVDFKRAEEAYQNIKNNSSAWKNYIPRIAFYKTNNQYHRWLFGDGGHFSRGLLRLDFGTSYITKQPISEVIFSKIGWSLFFAMLSVLLAYLVSIPVGVRAAANRGSQFDKFSSVILFMLYSMPAFWLATLLLMTFANTDVFPWFPASGVKPATGYPENAGVFQKIQLSIPYLILPAICYTYSSFAFLSRTMRVSMIETVGQDYIRTARAKGLPEHKVIWKHAFRNSLLPIITVFANIFPAAIGGSVIIESIFTIPGMGYETFIAIQSNNYPMIIAVFTITGFLTLIGYLVSDILYALVDPRISYR
jgi:peptide/nickel transport system permease protein